VKIVEERKAPDFGSLIDLFRDEWPLELGAVTDIEKVEEMEKNYDPATDTIKYLIDGGRKIGWYRYTKWPRNATSGGVARDATPGDAAPTDTAHTLDIGVLPECRGKGYGALLLKEMITDCSKRGFKKLMSRTVFGNTSSIRLHEACGFKESFRTGDSIIWEISLAQV
jgi:GNAT superfamily N-acetyltransferase